MDKELITTLLPQFIADLESKDRSPSTILAYKSDLEQMSGFLKQRNINFVADVKKDDLEALRDFLLSSKYTPKSTSRKLNAVKTFFRWLKDTGKMTQDPSREVSHPKITSSVPKFLSQLEYRALRDVVRSDAKVAAIVELILQTGMRISEVANLKMANVKKNELTIEKYATQPQRTIPLNNAAVMSIEEYLRKRPQIASEFVFISKNGKPLAVRNIRAAIDRYMQRAEIPGYSVNDLRTTFMVESLKRGVDLVLLSQIAGHKRLSTTERYLEVAGVSDPGKKQELEEL